jgi:hypothetical protein
VGIQDLFVHLTSGTTTVPRKLEAHR